MTTKVLRKIIHINEEKCNGCGACTTSCAEGALALVDGKARLIKDKYCDGLAACLKECPQGALTIVEREAEDFDEEETKTHLQETKIEEKKMPCGCQGSIVRQFDQSETTSEDRSVIKNKPLLCHWPVQLTLVPAGAKFLDQADVVLIADCVPFAYPDLHRDFLKDHAVLVACPKLDDFEAHLAKLTEILSKSQIKSLTVVHMEVPCCSGLAYIAKKGIEASGREIPLKEVTISVKGNIKPEVMV